MTIAQSQNAQFTNSMAFGQSMSNSDGSNSCKSNNHCVDRGMALETQVVRSILNCRALNTKVVKTLNCSGLNYPYI